MNVHTGEIYVTQEAIDAARARGETVIELSDGICTQLYTIEKAQAELDRQKRVKELFMSIQVPKMPYSPRF